MFTLVRHFTVKVFFYPSKRYNSLSTVKSNTFVVNVSSYNIYRYSNNLNCVKLLGFVDTCLHIFKSVPLSSYSSIVFRVISISSHQNMSIVSKKHKRKCEISCSEKYCEIKKKKKLCYNFSEEIDLKAHKKHLKKKLQKLLAIEETKKLKNIHLHSDNIKINIGDNIVNVRKCFPIKSIEEVVVELADQVTFIRNLSQMSEPVKENERKLDINKIENLDGNSSPNIEYAMREALINFSKHVSILNLEGLLSDKENVQSNEAVQSQQESATIENINFATYNSYNQESYEIEKYKTIRESEYTVRGHGFHNEPYEPEEKKFVFKIVSYNVLSQTLLEDNMWLYRSHNPQYLNWTYRSNLLMKELLGHDADIICLQEVEAQHKSSFYDQLEKKGYKGIFKKRTHDKVDGCAIYYKTSKFELIDYRTVEFFQRGTCLLDRDNIGIVAKLHPVGYPWRPIVIATTHLLYNPRRHDVKLAQICVLLAEIERLAYVHKDSKFKYHPVILTGDFNLEPYTSVYDFLVNGSLQYDILDRRTLKYAGPRPSYDKKFLSRGFEPIGKGFLPPFLGITDNCQHYGILEARDSQFGNKLSSLDSLIGIYNSDIRNSPQKFLNAEQMPHLFQTGRLANSNFDFYSVYYHENEDNETEATTKHNQYITVDYMLYTPLIDKHIKHQQLQLMSRDRMPVIQEWRTFIKNIPNKYCPSDHLPLIARFFLRIPPKDKADEHVFYKPISRRGKKGKKSARNKFVRLQGDV